MGVRAPGGLQSGPGCSPTRGAFLETSGAFREASGTGPLMFCSCAIRSCVSLKVASSPDDLPPPPAAALALKPIEDLANHVSPEPAEHLPQQSMASTGTPGGPGPATTARTWRCDTPSPPAGQPSPASDMHSPTVLASQSSTAADSMGDADTLIDRLSLGHAAEPLNRSTSLRSESWTDAQPLQDDIQDFRDSFEKDLRFGIKHGSLKDRSSCITRNFLGCAATFNAHT